MFVILTLFVIIFIVAMLVKGAHTKVLRRWEYRRCEEIQEGRAGYKVLIEAVCSEYPNCKASEAARHLVGGQISTDNIQSSEQQLKGM